MTELNDEYGPEAAQPAADWPEAAMDDAADPSVSAIAAVLGGVHSLPVAEHEHLYDGLHDSLLEALNEAAPEYDGGA